MAIDQGQNEIFDVGRNMTHKVSMEKDNSAANILYAVLQ